MNTYETIVYLGSLAALAIVSAGFCLEVVKRSRHVRKALVEARDWRDLDRRARHALLAYVSRLPNEASFFGEPLRLRVPDISMHYPEHNYPDHFAQKGGHLTYSAYPVAVDRQVGVQVQVRLKEDVLVNKFISERDVQNLPREAHFFGEPFRLRVPHIRLHYPEDNLPDHFAQKGERLVYSAYPELEPVVGVRVQVKFDGDLFFDELIEERASCNLKGDQFFDRLMARVLCRIADIEEAQQSRVDQGYSLEALRTAAAYPWKKEKKPCSPPG